MEHDLDEFDAFTVLSEETLAVLLDLPPELRISKLETTHLLNSDGSRRTVHLVHFKSARPQWRGEVDFTYHLRPSENATSLHSIGYSSRNLDEEGSHGPQGEDARTTG